MFVHYICLILFAMQLLIYHKSMYADGIALHLRVIKHSKRIITRQSVRNCYPPACVHACRLDCQQFGRNKHRFALGAWRPPDVNIDCRKFRSVAHSRPKNRQPCDPDIMKKSYKFCQSLAAEQHNNVCKAAAQSVRTRIRQTCRLRDICITCVRACHSRHAFACTFHVARNERTTMERSFPYGRDTNIRILY